jgi:hypothetical protein
MDTKKLTRPIHPQPLNVEWNSGVYEFGSKVMLYCNLTDQMQLKTMQQLWSNFTMGTSALEIHTCKTMPQFCAFISETEPETAPKLAAGFEYTVSVTEKGFALAAENRAGLAHAFFTALQLFNPRCLDEGKIRFAAPYVSIQDRPDIAFRGIHLCVFPETTLLLLEKAIRMAGFMKFTHVVLEFWGTLEYEAMPELHWKDHFFTKAQVKPLIDIAQGMGMQVIPMFNHLGHAAAARECYGRHVILNQNPKRAMLFEPDGWTWCLSNPDTLNLLRAIRGELIELCGQGDYFLIGCDEAYSYATCDSCSQKDSLKMLAEYLNGLSKELKAQGRRAIMWGDALLDRDEWKAPSKATGQLIPKALPMLDRDLIIADWQYSIKDDDVPTSKYFMEQGFDTLLCPWDGWENMKGLAQGAKKLNAFGVLATTWHHLPNLIRWIPYSATTMWGEAKEHVPATQSASILRKLVLTEKFEDAGWNKWEVEE